MLNLELLKLVNDGQAIAFIGAGVSCNAGVPSWAGLYQGVRKVVAPLLEEKLLKQADAYANSRDFPKAFQILKDNGGGNAVDTAVCAEAIKITKPGSHHHMLADWPFHSYIVSNYDLLLDNALMTIPEAGGWAPVGNTASEVRKVSGNPQGVIWHLHGACGLSPEVSRLIVSDNDYAELYPASQVAETLVAIFRMTQVVFIGFGFGDRDLDKILEVLSRHLDPSRPHFAFLGQDDPFGDFSQQERDRYRVQFNVECIPYRKVGDDHSDLTRVLEAYSTFIIRRSISFGEAPKGTPEYDLAVTSLHVHNQLVEGSPAPNKERLDLLCRAWVVALLARGPLRKNDICTECGAACGNSAEKLSRLRHLEKTDLIRHTNGNYELGKQGISLAANAESTAALAASRFHSSIKARVQQQYNSWEMADLDVTVSVISSFFEGICRERGLGVAQNLATHDPRQRSLRTVALMKDLTKKLSGCPDRNTAFVAIKVVASVMAEPRQEEAEYLGWLSQAYFGKHLLRASDEIRLLERSIASNTLFLVDASLLIPMLAKGCTGHQHAIALLAMLRDVGAGVTTSDLFLVETVEHAGWAARLVVRAGEDSTRLLDAARGARGYRSNLFLQGYIHSVETTYLSFDTYLAGIFPKARVGYLNIDDVHHAIEQLGIIVRRFEDWPGCNRELLVERGTLQEEIGRRRKERKSYQHERQTLAEAEAALIVRGVRNGTLRGKDIWTDALFASHTRIVEGLPNIDGRIMILPEGLSQWLWSSRPMKKQDARALFGQLLIECSEEGVEFISSDVLLRRFGGLVEAGKKSFTRMVAAHRELLLVKYGPDPSKAFEKCPDVEFPFMAGAAAEGAIEEIKKTVEYERKRREEAEHKAKLDEKEKQDYEQLKTRRQQKRQKERKRQGAARSRKKKRSKNRR